MKISIFAFLFLCLSFSAQAIAPQFWEENTQQNFADGDPQFVSITSDGELLLAPQLKKIYAGSDAIIWKIVSDSSGNLFAATGNEGKVIKIDASGTATTFLDTKELEIQALIIDKQDNLFAATSPDGKIYKIQRDGTAKVLFDPDDRYIWSLALDDAGNLYAGTGDQGKVYSIDRDGKGKLLIDTDELNITVLAWDKKRNLLAGSDRNGILYSIDPSGKAFVLFDTELQQVTSIHSDPVGDIYFSAISGIAAAPEIKPPTEITITPPSPTGQDADQDFDIPMWEVTSSVEVMSVQQVTPTPTPRGAAASQVYRLSSEGSTEIFYTSGEDQILDISGYQDGSLLLSTGKKAKLIVVDKNKKSTILLKATEEQMTSLLHLQKIWIATANPGSIYQFVEDHSSKGTYFSDVKDTQTLSTWGQMSWRAETPAGTSINMFTRSGNTKTPDNTWSAWSAVGAQSSGAEIQNPKARFLQWKGELSTTDMKVSPTIRSVRIAYLQKNVRPEILSITIHPLGSVFRRASVYPQDDFAGLQQPESLNQDQSDATMQQQSAFDQPYLGKREYRKGFQTITWSATDQNQDQLRFDVYYRADLDKTWKELGKELKEKVIAWDSQTIPDGTYRIKVVATDSGSNPQEYALSHSKESDPFDIDNSDPVIQVTKAYRQQNTTILEVQAKDQFSAIKELQYSVKPGTWNVVFPVDSINDSIVETYKIEIKDLSPPPADVVLRCTDRVNNVSALRYSLSSLTK
ncbi:MAG TPA: hypothetical protein VJ521_10270 [Acidobacteriota bacterium]|nr:hypothetical protein [Acidobacteriota bacterium]